jgi:heptosyltransferase-2
MHTAASIDVFSSHALIHIFEQMPEIDEIIENPFGHGQLNLRDRLEVARDIKSRRYDTTYVLPNSLKSALIPFFAKIPNRVGYTGEFRFGLINRRHTLDKNKYSLLASQYLQLAKTDLSESITLSEYPALTVAQRDLGPTLERFNIDPLRPYICLCPGAEYGPAKRWPQEHFTRLAQKLADKHFHTITLGGENDMKIGAMIYKNTHQETQDLTGKTTVKEAIQLIAGATCVVTNDSGLMHVAAALSRPLIALFGSSSPEYTPPLSDKAKVLTRALPCSPCFKRVCPLGHTNCLKDITVDEVFINILKLTASN